jgi:hypothetical protein
MVTAELQDTAQAVNSVLETPGPVEIVAVGASTAGGVILAQRIADRVLPELDFNPEPKDATDAFVSAGLKGGLGVATGFAARELSGVASAIAAFAGLGMLTSGGIDLFTFALDAAESEQVRRQTGSLNRAPTTTAMTAGQMGSGANASLQVSGHGSYGDERMEVTGHSGETTSFASV